MVKLGVNAWPFPKEVSVEEMLKKAREAEFDGFEAVLTLQDIETASTL